MKTLHAVLIIALLAALPASAAVTFEKLPVPIPDQGGYSVSYDGSRIAASIAGQLYLYENGSFTLLAQTSPELRGCAISGDGTVIFANQVDSLGVNHPVLFREADGWQPQVLEVPEGYLKCDYDAATAYALNHDGTKATGLVWDYCTAKAFLWTAETGMQDLGESRGSEISADGSVIVGFRHQPNGQGRSPAMWPVEGNLGQPSMGLHDPWDEGEVYDVTSDGSRLVGTAYPVGSPPEMLGYQAFIWDQGDTAITLLGTLTGSMNDISKATLISDDGKIFGVSGPSTTNITSFIWTLETGMVNLKQYLIDNGAQGLDNATFLMWPSDISRDGTTLVGQWADLYGGFGYYKAVFDDVAPVAETPMAGARLVRVHPNPFNPMTTVEFALDHAMETRVAVYDLAGRRVAVLADRVFQAGDHSVTWQGRDAAGRPMASGSYVIRLENASGADQRTVTLVK